ncbi:MAG: amino acid permease, partial [Candidatus Micrarchaeota archaeon]|nr:amino acid permease [Candidatus Micrarchaeota archaeon]
ISPAFSGGIGQIAIAEVALLITGTINVFGVKITSRINILMSIFFMAIFAIIIVLALLHGNPSNLSPFFSGSSGAMGIILAIPIAILAYGSWTVLITIPEETAQVKKIPKAVFWSILAVTIFYALLVLAVYLNVSAKSLNDPTDLYPVYILVSLLGSSTLTAVFQIGAVLAIAAVMLVMVLSNARILYALANLNFLPQSMNKMNNSAIPIYATLLSFIIPMALSVFPDQYYQYVVIGAIIGTGLPRIIDLASYLKIRNVPSYHPSYRVRYGLAVALIAFAGLVISELSLGISDVTWSVAAFVLLTLIFVAVDWRRK